MANASMVMRGRAPVKHETHQRALPWQWPVGPPLRPARRQPSSRGVASDKQRAMRVCQPLAALLRVSTLTGVLNKGSDRMQVRRVKRWCLAAVLLAAAAHPVAAQHQVGGGLGYLFDELRQFC